VAAEAGEFAGGGRCGRRRKRLYQAGAAGSQSCDGRQISR